VSLTELRTVRGKLGLPVERDEHFDADNPCPLMPMRRGNTEASSPSVFGRLSMQAPDFPNCRVHSIAEFIALLTIRTTVPVMVPVPMTVLVPVSIVVAMPVTAVPIVVRRIVARRIGERLDDGHTGKTNTYTDVGMRFGGDAMSDTADPQRSTQRNGC
jgi:hypothetical protein